MRELKFRVYHKKEKRMYYPGQFRMKFNRDHQWYVLINPVRAPESPKLIEIMQYIGLKDKNGTMIYEGDILRGWSGLDVVEVIWLASGFWFVNRGKALQQNFVPTADDIKEHEYEVIGNIYQNPDLLT